MLELTDTSSRIILTNFPIKIQMMDISTSVFLMADSRIL